MNAAAVASTAAAASGPAQAVTRAGTAAGADASFAATLDRSRQVLAADPAMAGNMPVAAHSRKAGPPHEQPADGAGAQPDPLALLLAGAAIVSHANPAPARATSPTDALAASPALRKDDPTAAANAAAPRSHLQEPPGHELLAVPDRPVLARPATGMDGAAASPAALADAHAARAAAPAQDARGAPDTPAASVDLAALAGRARLPARAGAGPADRSHALPSEVAPHAEPAVPAAAGAAAVALSAAGSFGSDGRASHEHQAAGDEAADAPLGPALVGAPPVSADAAVPAADAPAAVAPPVGSSEWAPALAQQIVKLAPGRSQIQLNLHPADLGPLTVKLTVGAAQAQVMFVAEHAAVRQALQAALPQLRTTLAESGISLGQASVGGGGGGGQAGAQPGGGEPPPRREAAARPARTAEAAPIAPRTGSALGVDAFA
jgi:flagellar hook-length control protein FliK